jgi:hypothetical protein
MARQIAARVSAPRRRVALLVTVAWHPARPATFAKSWGHARVDRVVVGARPVPLDSSRHCRVPRTPRRRFAAPRARGFRPWPGVDDELLPVVPRAPAGRVAAGVQCLPLRRPDVSNRTRAPFARTDFRQHALAWLGPELHEQGRLGIRRDGDDKIVEIAELPR